MPFIKPIAAILGYIYFGFFGAVFGWIGGMLLNTLITDGPQALLPGGRQAIKEHRQAVFIETLFSLMGRLAKADTHVSQAEIDHVESFIAQLGMTAEHRTQAIGYFQTGVNADFHVDEALARFLEVCGRSFQMKHLLLVYLAGVALADGQITQAEHELMQRVATRLGYSAEAFAQLMAMIQGQDRFAGAAGGQYRQQGAAPPPQANTLEDAYQALGVSASASDKELKRAYRKLISQYHPDKLIGQGVPEDMIQKATERSKEIHTAYDLIMKHRQS